MLRNALFALVALCLNLGLAESEEYKGKITKIGDGKVTISYKDKGTKKVETKELSLAKEVKVSKLEDAVKATVADGLKADVFSNINAKKGLKVSVTTNADNQVTEIVLDAKKKKKKE
jgi:hypothetical protein